MPTPLLERESALEQLYLALSRVRAGQGHVVLLAGEAGMGKSSLVDHFTRAAQAQAPLAVWWGGCDALQTPRPLGPLYDMAAQSTGPLAEAMQASPQPTAILAAMQGELMRAPHPTVLVFEDLHWADHATLDLVQLLGRRVARLPVLLLLTYRADQATHDGSDLQRTLAALPATSTTRLPLATLSLAAVTTLAQQHADPRAPELLFKLTQGHPFFLSEVLACPTELVPASVREAVLTHMHTLTPQARQICEIVSVVPGPTPLVLLDPMFPMRQAAKRADALDACLKAGVLRQTDDALSFHHELARLAVIDSLSPQRRQHLHAQVLEVLQAQPNTPAAQLVHHADGARLPEMVLALAPQAAQEATRHGAHREAVAHYTMAMPHLAQASAALRAQILEGWALAEAVVTWPKPAIVDALEQAVALWRQALNPRRAALALLELSVILQALWQVAQAERCLVEAAELLQGHHDTDLLVRAYNQRAAFYMRNSQTDLALLWGDRAMALSAQVSADPKLSAVEAQMAIGSALMRAGHPDGVAWLTRCIQEARALGHYKALISASMYLCESHQRQYRFAEAEVVCEQSIVAFSETGYLLHYFLGLQALLLVYRGDYAQAMARASTVLDRLNGPPTVMQWPLLLAAGLARCRHGTPGGLALLQQCFELSQGFTAYYLLPATNALIEAQMLQGDPDSARATLLRGWAGRGHETSPWLIAPLKAWALRLNVPLAPDPPPGAADRNAPQPWPAATPFEREMAGDHAGAAAFWAEAQAPYEQAYMLMRCGSVGVQQAIELWSKLGAHPAESRARAEARQMGLRGVRRGPYGAGRHNPLGLSARELQVLHLLSEGHSNAHIARLLTRSERTIEHHVSSMLAKAGAPHRSALVQQARSAGLLGHPAAAHLQN